MRNNLDRSLMAGIFTVFVFTAGVALINNYSNSKNVYTSNAISNISVYPNSPCSQLTTYPGVINNPETPNDPCAKQITVVPDCFCQNNYWTQACGFPFAGNRCDQPPPCICNPNTLKWDGGCGPSWGQSCNLSDRPPVLPTKKHSPYPPVSSVPSGYPPSPSVSISAPVPSSPSTIPPTTTLPISNVPPITRNPEITQNPEITHNPEITVNPIRINTRLENTDVNGNCIIDTSDFLTAMRNFGQEIWVHNKLVKVTVTYLSMMLANLSTKVCAN